MAPSTRKNNSTPGRTKKKVQDQYFRRYLPTFFDRKNYIKGVDVSSRSMNWGMGLEHEVQLFHINQNETGKADLSKSNIIFDSQESTCFLTKDKSEYGPCCKMRRKVCYNKHPKTKKQYSDTKNRISESERKFLEEVPWELSGRQQKGCRPNPVLLKRIPILMPEFVTTNHKNRSIESLWDELIYQENKFVELQMKNPHTKEKVAKYGEIRQLPYGAISKVKVPIRPTIGEKSYQFEEMDYKDYLGSYHVTMTLPCHDGISDKDFVELHRNFGKQVQMIEPLLIASFFSPDPDSVGDNGKKIEGSFRVMSTGWGNLAGSDLRKLDKGVGRYANIETNWRKTLNFDESKALHDCNKEVYIDEPNAVGILSSDFRTFGFDFTDSCPGKECPKVSGAPMVFPNGVELRIFDHFNSFHLIDLIRILVYLAENSRVKECKKYIYNDKSWKNTLRDIMKEGWNASISESYLNLLRRNLGLELEIKDGNAFDVLKELVRELFVKHKDGLYPTLMIEKKYTEPPILPGVNRFAWQISFNKKYGNKFLNILRKNIKKGESISRSSMEKIFYEHFPKKKWHEDFEDVLYTFEARPYKMLTFEKSKGKITKINRIK
jgi:hypothetical protein